MTVFQWLIQYQRLVFALTVLTVLVGVISYGTMARQEDPSFPYRAGSLQVIYPGATAEQIEKLITVPLEEELAQVEELAKVTSTSRDNISIVSLQLADMIYDTDAAWDRVRRAMERAEREFPDGVQEMTLEDRRMEIPTVVLSITGSEDPIVLSNAAERLKRQLLSVDGVSRVEINGAPEEELYIDIDSRQLNKLGINRQQIAGLLEQRNQLIPGGLINAGGYFIRLNTESDLQRLEDIRQLPVTLPNGQRIPLEAIASIGYQPQLPLAAQTFHDGARAVSLGVIAERGQTDAVGFGERIRQRIAQVQDDYQPMKIHETFFQPDFVAQRLNDLQLSLLISAVVIAAVVMLALGWRTGVLVALVLPVVALITLAVYNLGGGILHQIAVIGGVISLGILIDNAIVIVESIEAQLRAGLSRAEAVKRSVKQLAMPLFSSTGTTVAAFVPLLLSKGATADFTRGIPVMIILALITSYFISVVVLPLVAFYWLEPGKVSSPRRTEYLAEALVKLHGKYRYAPLLVVLMLMVSAIALAPHLKMQFFPGADRNQVVVDIQLPAGTPVSHTLQVSEWLEDTLKRRDDVTSVMRTVGASGFRFFYNLQAQPGDPGRARLMVNTESFAANQNIIRWVETEAQQQMPDAVLVAKGLGQGPPLPAPIEIRLRGDDPERLVEAANKVLNHLHHIDGTRNVRSNLDRGMPELALQLNDDTMADLALDRAMVAGEVFAQTRGIDSGEFRYGEEPVTMRVRSNDADSTALSMIPSLYVYRDQEPVPLSAVAAPRTRWATAELHRYNFQPTVTLLSELQPGAAYNQVLAALKKRLGEDPLDSAVHLSVGGEAEGSADANRAILTTAPLGLMLLLLFMLLQFNSFRRIGIILTTIPLAAVGIVPGLVLSDSPFGFQPLLGVIALIGIVVNNAIVLVDVVDAGLRAKLPIRDAVNAAIRQRTAPILLTTATTVLGLLPLAFAESTLWPPMAWAIISGLLMSTLLTLVVVPSLCLVLLKPSSRADEVSPSVADAAS